MDGENGDTNVAAATASAGASPGNASGNNNRSPDNNFNQIGFYCYECRRSFLSDTPKCMFCQGEFVETISPDVVLHVSFDEDDFDDDYDSDGDDDNDGAADDGDDGDVQVESDGDDDGSHGDDYDDAAEHGGDYGGLNAFDIDDPSFVDMLTSHLQQHTQRLRQQHPELGLDDDFIRRHIDAAVRAHSATRNAGAAGTNSNGGSAGPSSAQGNGSNTSSRNDSRGQDDGNDSSNNNSDAATTNSNNSNNNDSSRNNETGVFGSRTMRIPLPGGNEIVVVLTSDSPGLHSVPLPSLFGFMGAEAVPAADGTGPPQQSVLHPLLRALGYAGDPRDYVNDPHRFAAILDRLFQASEGLQAVSGLSAGSIAKLQRVSGCPPDATCPVCMDPGDGAPCIRLSCGHVFHEGCLVPWLERSATCPVCRSKQT